VTVAHPKPNIFLITIDSLRRDFVSLYGAHKGVTPFLDRLAEMAVVCEQAYTPGLWTDPAIVSLYTGLYPNQHRILAGVDTQLKARTLAEVLKENGYQTAMIGVGSRYISEERRIVKGFDALIDTFDIRKSTSYKHLLRRKSHGLEMIKALAYNGVYGRDCRIFYSLNRFKALLRQRERGPLFAHVHLWFFHTWYALPWHKKWPYLFRVPGFNYRTYLRLKQKVQWLNKKSVRVDHQYLCDQEYLDENDLQAIRWLYAASAHYVDDRLAIFFRWTERVGFGNHTIWIITADHGEMLGEHGLLSHNFSSYQEVIRVPMLIYGPEWIQPRWLSHLVTHADIPNTVLRLLGISENLGDTRGSILDHDFVQGNKDRPIFFEDGRPGDIVDTLRNIDPQIDFTKWDFAVKGIVQNGWKYVMKSNGGEELYNLEKDPSERFNRAAEHGQLAQELRNAVQEQLGTFNPESPIGL